MSKVHLGKLLAIAALCHSANAAYCASIGDTSQVPWEDAPDWQKESAFKGVEFCLANPDAPASSNHVSWMAEKAAAGWVYGEKKDPDATPPTHPCMVEFEQLPIQQQVKDMLFKAIVAGAAQIIDDDGFIHGVSSIEDDGHADLAAQLDTANARIAELEGQRDAAKRQAKVAKAALPPTPRSLRVKEPLTGDALADAIADAEDVEIAFSDGKKEIAGLEPIIVSGDAWKPSPHGIMLREPIEITGPQQGKPGYPIEGYALILDGKAVAYTRRFSPVHVAPGATVRFADDIYFA